MSPEREARYAHLPQYPDASMDWHEAAQSHLKKLCQNEYNTALAHWTHRLNRSPKTFRMTYPSTIDDLVNALGRNDKEAFYAIKLQLNVIPDSIKD